MRAWLVPLTDPVIGFVSHLQGDILKHARLIFTYRMSARMSDYLYTHIRTKFLWEVIGVSKVASLVFMLRCSA